MLIPVIEQTGSTVKVQGKYDLEDVFIGQQYELRYTFSHQFLRESSQNGSQSALVSGRLQMRAWTLVFEDSGFFSVSVTPKFRDTFLYKFTGTILGAGNNTIDQFHWQMGSSHSSSNPKMIKSSLK